MSNYTCNNSLANVQVESICLSRRSRRTVTNAIERNNANAILAVQAMQSTAAVFAMGKVYSEIAPSCEKQLTEIAQAYGEGCLRRLREYSE